MPNNNTIKWRLDRIEQGYAILDGKVDKILQNGLPHLHEEVSSLKTRVTLLTALNIGAVVVALVINRFL